MKIQCPNCKTVYQLDDKKIPNRKIKFKCRQCQNPVYIHKKNGSAKEPSDPKEMVCPKCGRRQAVSDECVHCGITVTQYSPEAKPNGDIQPKPKLKNKSQPQEKQKAKEEIVNCPKCSYGLQPDDLECSNCGIVLEKYKAFTAKTKQAEIETQQQVENVPAKSEEEIALEQEQTPGGAEKIVKEEKAKPDRVKCSACSKEISKDVKFCPHCGNPAESSD
jgi:predicted Zn finger-like uncharacterized protein